MQKPKLNWRGMKIDRWLMVHKTDIANAPTGFITSLCSIGLPVRVYKNNILQPELCGTLVKIERNGQLTIQLERLSGGANARRRSRNETEKTITFNNNMAMELPVFE